MLVWLAVAAAMPAAGQGLPRPREVDFVPPEWTRYTVQWAPTWEATLAANAGAEWTAQIAADKTLWQASRQVRELRRIELLKAMVERFGDRKDRHAGAYGEIAGLYQQLGMPWWRSYYGWKLAREFPGDPEPLARGYSLMLQWKFNGGYYNPDSMAWGWAIYEAAGLIDKGVFEPGHPLVNLVSQSLVDLVAAEDRYDEFHPLMRWLQKQGSRAAAPNVHMATLMSVYGHAVQAATYTQKAGRGNVFALLANAPVGRVRGLGVDAELESRWEAVSRGKLQGRAAIDPASVQAILDQAAQTGAYFSTDDTRYESFWQVVAEGVSRVPPERLAAVREAQEKACQSLVRSVEPSCDATEVARAFRRYPWAQSIHRLLVESGEKALAQGRAQEAAAAFRDALATAARGPLADQARVGLWLAMAQEADARAAMEAEMAVVPDAERLPWRGGVLAAGELKKQMRALSPGAPPAPGRLADLPRRRIELPAGWPGAGRDESGPTADMGLRSPWPIGQAELEGGWVYVAGANRAAGFTPGSAGPAWVCTTGAQGGGTPAWEASNLARYRRENWHWQFDRRPVSVRGAGSSAVDAGGAMVCLAEQGGSMGLAGADAATGRTLWTTRGQDDWKRLSATGQPTVAGGRVYVMAASVDPEADAGVAEDLGGAAPMHLVCLDARTGTTVWKRMLGWQPHTTSDLSWASAGVTVRDGAVYCSTNAGLVARVDMRDGLVQWVRGYASAVQKTQRGLALNYSREGTSPVLAGGTLVVAPRDHSGLLAYQARTGELLWEAMLVPSDRIVGVCGGLVVSMNDQYVSGVELATGRQAWCRKFPAPATGSAAAVVGGDVVVRCGEQLVRMSGATGQTVEQGPLNVDAGADAVLLGDGTLLEVKAPPLAMVKAARAAKGAAREVWTLPCEEAVLTFPETGQAVPDAFCVTADRRMAYVRTKPAMEVAWARLLHRRPHAVSVRGKSIVLNQLQEVVGLDAADGAVRWRQRLPFMPYFLGGDEKLAVAATLPAWEAHVAAIDPVGGKLLWSRSLAEGVRFKGGVRSLALARGADGSGSVEAVLETLFGDAGWRPAEVGLDAANGHIRQVRPFLPNALNLGPWLQADGAGVRAVAQDARLHVVNRATGVDSTAPWTRKMEVSTWSRYDRLLGVYQRPAGIYVKLLEELLLYEPGSGKETVYSVPKAPAAVQGVIFDFREAGGSLMVLSGMTGQMYAGPNLGILPHDVKESRVYLDVFDRASGRHVSRQELEGVRCEDVNLTGYDSQGRFVEGGLVVTDSSGVHVFAGGG